MRDKLAVGAQFAAAAQLAERVLGKDEVKTI